LKWIAEPGDFDIMIGASSEDIRLKDSFELID
jgi:beta-glucosidase